MTATSKTLLGATTHTGDSSLETVTSEMQKGDGYYGRSDGLHTIQYTYNGFSGTIAIEATLETDPQDRDWFSVLTKNIDQDSDSKIESFVGNYVWIRARIEYTDGTINSIVLNN